MDEPAAVSAHSKSSLGLYSWIGCFFCSSSPLPVVAHSNRKEDPEEGAAVQQKCPSPEKLKGGWRAVPFILGNEMCEKLALMGLYANLVVYLTTKYRMKKVAAANMLNVWAGTTSMATLAGAVLADSYLGKFRTITAGCAAYLLAMTLLTFTALEPRLRRGYTVLNTFLAFMAIGSACIRPCSMAFGAEQMENLRTSKARRAAQSFFNWYYMGTIVAALVAMTVIVYVQSNVSWSVGFGLCVALMLVSAICFLLGAPLYRHVAPGGSAFVAMLRVLVASLRKRHVAATATATYHGPATALTPELAWLNRAAVAEPGDAVGEDGRPAKPWRTCGAAEVEDVKCIIKTLPIVSCGVASGMASSQQHTFTTLQALAMDRRVGNLTVPAASVGVVSLLAVTAVLPLYDRVIVPALRRRGREISTLRRMGIGYALSAASVATAAAVEAKRRRRTDPAPVAWLIPQFLVMGVAEALHAVGGLEFFYREFPAGMRATAIAVSSITSALGRYCAALLVAVVASTTARDGHPGWLADNLNKGHLDRFYLLLAAIEALNLLYFVACARWYRYRRQPPPEDEELPASELKPTAPKSTGLAGSASAEESAVGVQL